MNDAPRNTAPPDFASGIGFGLGYSVLIMPDHLLIASHGLLGDKLERLGYDRMEYTVMRTSFPAARTACWVGAWGAIALLFLILALALHGENWLFLCAGIAAIPLAVCIARAVTLRNIELTLVRGGWPRKVRLHGHPQKAAQAYDRLTAAIQAEQARLAGM